MKKMRKILAISALILIFAVSPVFAQARYGIRTCTVTASTNGTISAVGAGTWVYGLKIYATNSNAQAGLYDTATQAGVSGASASPKDEIGEATQYESTETWYSTPIYFSEGVSVLCRNGVAFVYYGPQPE
jgi:hypothetical protein